MVDKIGDFLRRALATEHTHEVRLEDELDVGELLARGRVHGDQAG